MSEKGYFPLPDIVTVDPDLFKTAFPEWAEYVRRCPDTAGSLTRRESGYLVEIAQEVRERGDRGGGGLSGVPLLLFQFKPEPWVQRYTYLRRCCCCCCCRPCR